MAYNNKYGDKSVSADGLLLDPLNIIYHNFDAKIPKANNPYVYTPVKNRREYPLPVDQYKRYLLL